MPCPGIYAYYYAFLDLSLALTVSVSGHQVDTCCRALSERLGKETYFFGRQPTPLDALVYGHLYTIITTPLQDTRLASIVNGYSNLVKLTNHVDAEYFKGMEIIG